MYTLWHFKNNCKNRSKFAHEHRGFLQSRPLYYQASLIAVSSSCKHSKDPCSHNIMTTYVIKFTGSNA